VDFDMRVCPDCEGAEHLRGTLPPQEWSPAVRRKVRDSLNADDGAGPESWCAWLNVNTMDDFDVPRPTRTVPRGEHRRGNDPVVPSSRCRGYGPYRWCPPSNGVRFTSEDGFALVLAYAPSWRRGELENARRQGWRSGSGPGPVVLRSDGS